MKIPIRARRNKIVHWICTRQDLVTIQRWRLDFIPEANVPGFTHRVAINGHLTRSYLQQECKPNAASAIFFCEKHANAYEVMMLKTGQPGTNAFFSIEPVQTREQKAEAYL